MPPAAVRVITWNVNGIRARFREVGGSLPARATGHSLPAGNQGDRGAGARAAHRPARLPQRVARWTARLLGGEPARSARRLRRPPALRSDRLRRRVPGARAGHRRAARALGVRPERQSRPAGQDVVPPRPRRPRRGRARRRSPAPGVRRPQRRAHRHGRPRAHAQSARGRSACRRSGHSSSRSSTTAWSISCAPSIPTITACSPGGRRGGRSGAKIAGGGSTTSSPVARSRRRAVGC